MALTRLWRPSPHHSARSGTVRLIVLHTTEGAQDDRVARQLVCQPVGESLSARRRR